MITKETPIGFVGLGVIGGAMARNLLKAGFKVTVHNRSRAKVEFRAGLLLKDIKLAQSTGRDVGSFMPVTALGLQLLTALCNSGRDSLDSAALGLLFEELSGITR